MLTDFDKWYKSYKLSLEAELKQTKHLASVEQSLMLISHESGARLAYEVLTAQHKEALRNA
jgi:hypothetical protein